jgi:hypothetical protein
MYVLRSTQRAAFALVALAVVATVASGCHGESKASPDPTTPTTTAPRNCATLYNGDPQNPAWRQCMGMHSD